MECSDGETALGAYRARGGTLHVTDRRVAFEGTKGGFEFLLDDIRSFAASKGELRFACGNPRRAERVRLAEAPAAGAAIVDALKAAGRRIA